MRRNIRRVEAASSLWEQAQVVAAILNAPVPGIVVECGSYKGGSAVNLSLAARMAGRKLLLCDSFAGLPRPSSADAVHTHCDGITERYSEGDWCGTLAEVKANVSRYGAPEVCEFLVGYFDNTLPRLRESVAVAFCDVDLTDSLRTCLRYLWPLMPIGGAIFTHEAHQLEVASLFFDRSWWKSELSCEAPGLIGAGSGLGLHPNGHGYSGSCLGYVVKRA